jgi:GDP/UDP-N,N'-diacetylbacillosamine 2-epimerase (hydrolysing)
VRRRRICVVTGSRAEYGLLRWVLGGIREFNDLELQLVVTGTHLSPEFGLTYRTIEQDGFHIDARVEMLLSSDTAVGATKSLGLGLIGFADACTALRPDVLVVVGDRYEILAAAASAMIARVPIAHIHGGEATEGAIDESVRHAVTKMAHLHFVATEEYRRRVLQLGEQPERVFLVGGLGVDAIQRLALLERDELERALDFALGKRNLLVTFHAATLEEDSARAQVGELLTALAELRDTHCIFTLPNADTETHTITRLIEKFVAEHPRLSKAFRSLGDLRYLSCMKHCDAVVGNSSSGLTEAPTFRKGTVNIGDRQRGRLRAASVIDCEPNVVAIRAALRRLYSAEFVAQLPRTVNPYGEGGASEKIVQTLRTVSLDGILKKRFHDVRFD